MANTGCVRTGEPARTATQGAKAMQAQHAKNEAPPSSPQSSSGSFRFCFVSPGSLGLRPGLRRCGDGRDAGRELVGAFFGRAEIETTRGDDVEIETGDRKNVRNRGNFGELTEVLVDLPWDVQCDSKRPRRIFTS